MVMSTPQPQDIDAVEEEVLGEPVDPDHLSGPGPSHLRSRGARLAAGVAGIVAGIVLILLGATILATEIVMLGRVVLVIVGIGVAYWGVARTVRAIAGEQTDVAYWLSVTWLVLLVGSALLAPLLPLGEASDSAKALSDPINVRPDLFSDFPLGTNKLGLDMLARSIYGARVSLVVSLVAALIGGVLGGFFGLIAGYLRGWSDTAIGIVTNVMLAFPPLVLLLALAAVLPRNVRNQAIALSILVIPVNIRLARAMSMSSAQREFVLAARAIGAKKTRIMFRELLPNVAVPLISYGFIVIAMLIVAEASLSFLGLGIPPPDPTWGNMIAEGQNGVFEDNPHIVLVPAGFLFLTVLSFNLVGERLRQRFASGRQVEL